MRALADTLGTALDTEEDRKSEKRASPAHRSAVRSRDAEKRASPAHKSAVRSRDAEKTRPRRSAVRLRDAERGSFTALSE